MTTATTSAPAARTGLRAAWNRIADALERWIGHSLLALAARFAIAGIFFMSGRTKVEGWLTVSDSAIALFADEYKVPVLSPALGAHFATYAEHLFPSCSCSACARGSRRSRCSG
jgi:putative oxidoreductase